MRGNDFGPDSMLALCSTKSRASLAQGVLTFVLGALFNSTATRSAIRFNLLRVLDWTLLIAREAQGENTVSASDAYIQ